LLSWLVDRSVAHWLARSLARSLGCSIGLLVPYLDGCFVRWLKVGRSLNWLVTCVLFLPILPYRFRIKLKYIRGNSSNGSLAFYTEQHSTQSCLVVPTKVAGTAVCLFHPIDSYPTREDGRGTRFRKLCVLIISRKQVEFKI
jgi:hypothetical protein